MTERKPLDVARDAWRTITRTAFRAVGLYWLATFLAGHFLPSAAKKYLYKCRTRAYRQRKDRAYMAGRGLARGQPRVIASSDVPLVLTGYMRDEMTTNTVVRGFPNRATVYLYGPSYAATHFMMNQPDKQKEITTVTEEERHELSDVLEQEIKKGIDSYRATRVTEIR